MNEKKRGEEGRTGSAWWETPDWRPLQPYRRWFTSNRVVIGLIDGGRWTWIVCVPWCLPLPLPPSFLPCLRSPRYLLCHVHVCNGVVGVGLVFLLVLARLVACIRQSLLANEHVSVYVAAVR